MHMHLRFMWMVNEPVKLDAPFQLTTGASNSVPMAVSGGEKRHEDRRRI